MILYREVLLNKKLLLKFYDGAKNKEKSDLILRQEKVMKSTDLLSMMLALWKLELESKTFGTNDLVAVKTSFDQEDVFLLLRQTYLVQKKTAGKWKM